MDQIPAMLASRLELIQSQKRNYKQICTCFARYKLIFKQMENELEAKKQQMAQQPMKLVAQGYYECSREQQVVLESHN
jgi:hypothetical protein